VSAVEVAAASPGARRSRLLWTRLRRQPLALAGLLVVVVLAGAALFAPYLAPYSPSAADFNTILAHPSRHHLLGTDELGRDVLSRLVWGARISITVGLLATLLALTIAVPLGLVAGFYRGWLDAVVARVTDVLLAFPFLILAIGLSAILGPSPTTATLALGIAAVPRLVRVTRAEALSLREADFVPAAIASGAGEWTILFRHLLPNMAPTLLVQATAMIPRVIIGEAALSFL
jgi:peptide/nickel transport system permease protein